MQKIIYTQTHNDNITLLHTQTHIVIHTNLSDTQQQLGEVHIQMIHTYRPSGVVCSYHYLCCITIDQDSQHQMAVVDTGPVQHLGVERHTYPSSQAMWSGVSLSSPLIFMLALLLTRTDKVRGWLLIQAQCTAVRPCLSCQLGSAPSPNRRTTSSVWP